MHDHDGFGGYFPAWDYPPPTPGGNYGVPGRQPLDWQVRWPERFAGEFLRARVGVDESGAVVELDLKPPAQGGQWPHVLCTGPEQSALFRTILVGLADGFSPDLVQFVFAEFGGTDNDPVSWIPHVATLANRLAEKPDALRSLVLALDTEIWRRRNLGDPSGEPVLVIALDDVDRLIAAQPELLDVLTRIGHEGEHLGLRLLLAATDASGLDTLRCMVLPLNQGYGNLAGRVFRMVAITPELLTRFGSTFLSYRHPVRPLWTPPDPLPYERVAAHDRPDAKGVPVGVAVGKGLGAVRLDFGLRSHLVVQGERGRGKTTVLRTVLRGIAEQYRAPGAVILDAGEAAPIVDRIAATLRRRLTDRGLWQGPELFLVLDDYDQVPADADPLAPLAELLRHGSSIGVHLVATAASALDDRATVRALPAKDCTRLQLRGEHVDRWEDTEVRRRWVPQFRWDTWTMPEPVGRAHLGGAGGGQVQIAIDIQADGPLEFRPLDEFLSLGAVDGPESPARAETPVRDRVLTAVIGEANAEPVHFDVRQHIWCGGDVGTGKTAFLQRVAISLASRYSPAVVQFLLADGDTRRLGELAGLPHTASYVPSSEPKDSHRLTSLLDDEVRRRLEHDEPGVLPHLVVFVDKVGHFVAGVPAAGDALRRAAALGKRLGISLVVAERDLVGQVLTDLHRMTDNRVSLAYHAENMVAHTLGVPVAEQLRHSGRGAAMARTGVREVVWFTLADPTPAEVREVRFRGPESLRAMPLSPPMGAFTYDELQHIARTQPKEFDRVPIGLLDGREQPVGLDFDRDRHFVVTGAAKSGRSTVLRTLLLAIAQRYSVRDCLVCLLHDNAIEGVIPSPYILATSAGFQPPPEMINEVLVSLRKRVGSPEWSGPRLFVVIDDYDLFAAEHDPLVALRELIPHAEQIGLHLLIAGADSLAMRAEIGELDAPRLALREGSLPGSAAGDVPALPEVGHGKLLPWNIQVRLPWSRQP